MALHVNIAKAKAILSELVAKAEAGEEVVLTRNGKAVVTLTPRAASEPPKVKRTLGVWNHLNLNIDADLFLQPDPELEEAAESRDEDEYYRA